MKNIIEESNGIRMIDFYDRGNLSYASDYIMSENENCEALVKYNRVIDLEIDEEILKEQIRKRFKGCINWGQRI